MSFTEEYYERYWADPQAAPPGSDPTTPMRQRLLRDALAGLPRGSKVLDLGCGGGEFTKFLSDLGYDATGTDMSASAIRFAKARFDKGDFRVGTPSDFSDEFAGRFDAIWCTEVLEHVFDVYDFLTSAHRCLVPDGCLIITTPYHGLIKNVVVDCLNYAQHYNPFGGHIRFFDRKSLNHCLQHCGFTPDMWKGYGRPWPLYRSFFVSSRKSHPPAPPPPADG